MHNHTNSGHHRRRRRDHTFRFESMHQPVISRPAFVRRLGKSFVISVAVIALSLVAGMVGYHVTEGMPWIDAYANASMILSGMGPLDAPKTFEGKLFAGTYALYSGLVVILATGVILAPILHRVLHHFHVDCEDGRSSTG
jgi:hypothetical protein